jgi:hypothetical protein
MTVESAENRGIERRALLRGGVLLGLGATAVAATWAVESGTAHAANSQPGWAWCDRCQQVWYWPHGFGSCPAESDFGLGHAFAVTKYVSYNYRPEYAYEGSGYQQGWRFCKNCLSLFHGNVKDGICCFHDGVHDGTGSYAYALWYDRNISNGQPGWRWCKYCYTLFYGTRQIDSACPRD